MCVAHRYAHVALANFSVMVFAMKTRPWPVIVVSCLLMAAGGVGLIYHLTEFKGLQPLPYELLLISLVRLLAIIFGVYMLLGRNWARWMAMAWIAFHVVLSAFHSLGEFADALLDPRSVCVCLCFRPKLPGILRGKSRAQMGRRGRSEIVLGIK